MVILAMFGGGVVVVMVVIGILPQPQSTPHPLQQWP